MVGALTGGVGGRSAVLDQIMGLPINTTIYLFKFCQYNYSLGTCFAQYQIQQVNNEMNKFGLTSEAYNR